jgi:solute carrier family 13 (sodium-dependent dicarboxylate transporter), member 2/3/5
MPGARTIALIAGPVLAVTLGSVLFLAGLGAQASCAAAVAGWCALWWITEPIPIPATSLIPFAVLPFMGVLTHKQVAGAYGHTLVLLFLGGFLLSAAMEKSGAHRRLALGMVRAVGGGGGRRLVLAFMLATALLSMWISNTATALMMLPIAMAVLDQADDDAKLAPPLLLGIAYAASIGGIGTPIGTPPNILFMGVYEEETGSVISFAQWMTIGVPVVTVMLPVAWLWLTRGMGRSGRVATPASEPWTRAEVRMLLIFAVTAAAWVSRPYWVTALGYLGAGDSAFATGLSGVGDSTIALLAAVALFVTSDGADGRLLDWPSAQKIPWGLLLLFGGGIAIAKAFTASGLADAIGRALAPMANWPTVLMILAICLAVTFLTEITSNTATTTMLMPVLAAGAIGAGLDPAVLMIPAALSASCAFMLPVATPPNAVVMGAGRLTVHRMAVEGFALNLIGAGVITAVCLWRVSGKL